MKSMPKRIIRQTLYAGLLIASVELLACIYTSGLFQNQGFFPKFLFSIQSILTAPAWAMISASSSSDQHINLIWSVIIFLCNAAIMAGAYSAARRIMGLFRSSPKKMTGYKIVGVDTMKANESGRKKAAN